MTDGRSRLKQTSKRLVRVLVACVIGRWRQVGEEFWYDGPPRDELKEPHEAEKKQSIERV